MPLPTLLDVRLADFDGWVRTEQVPHVSAAQIRVFDQQLRDVVMS